jgi:hypothetical protein
MHMLVVEDMRLHRICAAGRRRALPEPNRRRMQQYIERRSRAGRDDDVVGTLVIEPKFIHEGGIVGALTFMRAWSRGAAPAAPCKRTSRRRSRPLLAPMRRGIPPLQAISRILSWIRGFGEFLGSTLTSLTPLRLQGAVLRACRIGACILSAGRSHATRKWSVTLCCAPHAVWRASRCTLHTVRCIVARCIVARCMLHVARCVLRVVRCASHTARCLFPVASCTSRAAHCALLLRVACII